VEGPSPSASAPSFLAFLALGLLTGFFFGGLAFRLSSVSEAGSSLQKEAPSL